MSPQPTRPPSPGPTSSPTLVPTPAPSFAPEIFVSSRQASVAEADNPYGGGHAAARISVWLSNRPTGSVFVAVRSTKGQVYLNATETVKNPWNNDDTDPYGALIDDDGRGFAFVGPFTAEDWDVARHFTVAAYDDDAAEWSRGDALAATPRDLRFEGQCGDDVLSLAGFALKDPRYHGLAAPNVTVRCHSCAIPSIHPHFPVCHNSGVSNLAAGAG